MDLLLPPAFKNDPPKLEIKKDTKGMVTVSGATIVEVGWVVATVRYGSVGLPGPREQTCKHYHGNGSQPSVNLAHCFLPPGDQQHRQHIFRPLSVRLTSRPPHPPPGDQRQGADERHRGGPDAAPRGLHPHEPRVVPIPPHHVDHHREHQPADAERGQGQAELRGPGRVREVRGGGQREEGLPGRKARSVQGGDALDLPSDAEGCCAAAPPQRLLVPLSPRSGSRSPCRKERTSRRPRPSTSHCQR